MKYFNRFLKYILDKIKGFFIRNWRNIIAIILGLAIVSFIIWAIVELINMFIEFVFTSIERILLTIEQHPEASFLLVATIGGIIFLVVKSHKKPEQITPVTDNSQLAAAEHTYKALASAMLPVLQKVASAFALGHPTSYSDIYSPARAQKINSVWTHEYAMLKKGEVIVFAMEKMTRDELQRYLLAGEPNGLEYSKVLNDGLEEAAFTVSEAVDVGSHILIRVISTKKYMKQKNHQAHVAIGAKGDNIDADDDEFNYPGRV